MAEGKRGRRRSALSDITPSPGPGPIPTVRELDSLRRCDKAAEALFGSPQSMFSRFDRVDVARHMRRDALAEVVRWYWYNDMEDRRTKGSDLKRELAKVVTHLDALERAMAAVQPETRHALNRLLKPPTWEESKRQDIFGQAERLNSLILEQCRPLVAKTFTKEAATSVPNACKALASIWEGLSQQPFERNTKICPAAGSGSLVTDNYGFESDGMHFVHVMLQAIDPAVTYSKVRSGMRRVAACRPRKTIDPKTER